MSFARALRVFSWRATQCAKCSQNAMRAPNNCSTSERKQDLRAQFISHLTGSNLLIMRNPSWQRDSLGPQASQCPASEFADQRRLRVADYIRCAWWWQFGMRPLIGHLWPLLGNDDKFARQDTVSAMIALSRGRASSGELSRSLLLPHHNNPVVENSTSGQNYALSFSLRLRWA